MLWFFLVVGLHSQAVTPEQVLKTAWQDSSYASQSELRSTESRNPLRNVEAFASAEKEETKNEYEMGLKLQFRSWPEWKMQAVSDSRNILLKEAVLAWALYDRYLQLISYEISRQKLELLNRTLELSESYLKAQSLSLRMGRSSTKSFLGAQGDIYKLKRLKSTVEQEQSAAIKKIKQWMPDWTGDRLEGFELIAVEEMTDVLTTLPVPTSALSSRLSGSEAQDIHRELEILRGRERQWIKGMELSQTRKEDEIGYKVELTIQLPGLGADDLSRQKQNELTLKKTLKQKESDDSRDRLLTLKNQVQNLSGLYRMSKAGLQQARKLKATDTLTEIENRIHFEQGQLELLGQHQEVLLLFLNFLLESDRLVEAPVKNYLSKDFKLVAL